MKKIFGYLKKLVERDSQESSKRFMALVTMLLITYAVVRFTNSENIELILIELIGFVLALAGISQWSGDRKLTPKKEIDEVTND